jgi:hypothetical protein
MFKSVSFILGTLIFASVASAQASEKECKKETPLEKNLSELEEVTEKVKECPKPTAKQITTVCNSIYAKKDPTDEENFGFQFQEDFWEMSCASVGKDTPEQAKQKIQKMWNTSREEFRCDGHSDVTLHNANVLKFSVDTGFSEFLFTAIKKYELDVNFKDPTDGKTVLDFVEAELAFYRKSTFTDKANEYQRTYDLLIKTGAKRAKDL